MDPSMCGQDADKRPKGSAGDQSGQSTVSPSAPASGPVRHIRSADLFGDAREVVIEHEHHRYRLKMTSRGGLILNK